MTEGHNRRKVEMAKNKKKDKSGSTFIPDPGSAVWVGIYAEPMTWHLPKLPPIITSQGADVDGHHLDRIRIRIKPNDTRLVGFGVLVGRYERASRLFSVEAEYAAKQALEQAAWQKAEELVPAVTAIFQRLGIPGTVGACGTTCS